MQPSFSVATFVNRIGERLVDEFKDAALAGTPGLIGSAKEHPARRQLQRLLPATAAIGSGIVIDSFGNRSKQQDIVIYDRHHCPIFAINDTPEATYYPCEGVIAVGEVKSTIGDAELRDSFDKIATVKRLRRYSKSTDGLAGPTVAYRSYGATQCLVGTADEAFDQVKPRDQILGFVLCAKFGLADSTIHARATELWRSTPSPEAPNLLVSLEAGFLAPCTNGSLTLSSAGASHLAFAKDSGKGFPFLVDRLSWIVRNGRTVEVEAFQRYLKSDPEKPETYAEVKLLPLSATSS